MKTTIKTFRILGAVDGDTWFVGDVHGCYDLLFDKLRAINFDFTKDRLIATGDLIDHGHQSEKCLMLLKEPWFCSVIGNHEIMAIDAVNHRMPNNLRSVQQQLHTQNGGSWFYQINSETPQKRQDDLAELMVTLMPIAYEVSVGSAKIGVVHAASRTDWKIIQEEPIRINVHLLGYYTWTRYEQGMPKQVKGIDAVVMGHQNDTKIVRRGNQFWIDTIRNTGELTIISAADVLKRCVQC